MAVRYPDIGAPAIPELRPNKRLIDIREQFGIPGEFLLDDYNEYYTNMNDNAPIEKIDDGVSPDFKKYIMAGGGGGGITELLGSQDGAIGYVRPLDSIDGTGITGIDSDLASKFDQYKNYKRTDQDYIDEINQMRRANPNFNSYTDEELKQMLDMNAFSKRSNFKVPEKTGILQNIKDGGSKLLDFIKGGGVVGNIIKGFLPEQDPRAIFMRNYYGGKDRRNLTSSGSIASGLMKDYNPVSGGGLYTLTGGRLGEEPTYGLQNAYEKRINNIRDMLTDKYSGISADMTDDELEKYMSTPEGMKALRLNVPGHSTAIERYFKLKEEKAREAEAIEKALDISGKQAAQNFMNQNPNYGNPEANQNPGSGGGSGYDPGADYSGSDKRSEDNRSSDLGFSDIRLKENIELIGKSPSNINIYKFNYKDNPTTYQGAMAHEVPWASIKHSNGYMMVDYNKRDVNFKKI